MNSNARSLPTCTPYVLQAATTADNSLYSPCCRSVLTLPRCLAASILLQPDKHPNRYRLHLSTDAGDDPVEVVLADAVVRMAGSASVKTSRMAGCLCPCRLHCLLVPHHLRLILPALEGTRGLTGRTLGISDQLRGHIGGDDAGKLVVQGFEATSAQARYTRCRIDKQLSRKELATVSQTSTRMF